MADKQENTGDYGGQAMIYYLCEECHRAFTNPLAFHGHWKFKHGGEVPPTESVKSNELPEGYPEPPATKGKKPSSEKPPAERAPEERPPKTTLPDPALARLEELPNDPVELFRTLLSLKGIPPDKTEALTREFRLSPWMWGDAQEISSLLQSGLRATTLEWRRTFLKQYGTAVSLPSQGGTFEFMSSGRGARNEFFGALSPQQQSYASPNIMEQYLMRKLLREDDDKETRYVREKSEPDTATAKRLENLEKTLSDLMSVLTKQQEENKLEGRFSSLEQKIEKAAESKSEKSGGDLEWLKAYMGERDKREEDRTSRYESTVSDLKDSLINAQRTVAEARGEIAAVRAQAIAEEEERRGRMKKDMVDSGWGPRDRTKEEMDHDLLKEIVTTAGGEARELRKTVEKVAAQTTSTVQQAVTQPAQPPSTENHQRMAKALEIQEQMKSG